MATPTLSITATLNVAPASRAGELQALDTLVKMAVQDARGAGGQTTSGTVNSAFGEGSATWEYTPNTSS